MKDGYVYLGGPVIFVQDDERDGDDDHIVIMDLLNTWVGCRSHPGR